MASTHTSLRHAILITAYTDFVQLISFKNDIEEQISYPEHGKWFYKPICNTGDNYSSRTFADILNALKIHF